MKLIKLIEREERAIIEDGTGAFSGWRVSYIVHGARVPLLEFVPSMF